MLELDSTSSELDLAVLELDSVMEVLDSEAPDFYKVLRSMAVVRPLACSLMNSQLLPAAARAAWWNHSCRGSSTGALVQGRGGIGQANRHGR